MGLFKPTFIIRDAILFPRIAGLPDRAVLCTRRGLDVGSSETGRRRPTCLYVQVINGSTRHGGGKVWFSRVDSRSNRREAQLIYNTRGAYELFFAIFAAQNGGMGVRGEI